MAADHTKKDPFKTLKGQFGFLKVGTCEVRICSNALLWTVANRKKVFNQLNNQ